MFPNQMLQIVSLLQETRTVPGWFRAAFSPQILLWFGCAVSREPIPSPTGNFLSVLKLGSWFLSCAWQDIFSHGTFIIFSCRDPCQVVFVLPSPTLQFLCWACEKAHRALADVVLCERTILFCRQLYFNLFYGQLYFKIPLCWKVC